MHVKLASKGFALLFTLIGSLAFVQSMYRIYMEFWKPSGKNSLLPEPFYIPQLEPIAIRKPSIVFPEWVQLNSDIFSIIVGLTTIILAIVFQIHTIRKKYYLKLGTTKNKPYKLHISDFNSGAVITGATGTGKTTLRFHLIRFFRKHNIRILDFDYKGETVRHPQLIKNAKVIQPGNNYSIDLFRKPAGVTRTGYKNSLKRMLIEATTIIDPLSHQQISLLEQGVDLTFKQDGNIRNLFQNILYLGNQGADIDGMTTDKSAIALIQKMGWLQNSLADIFWRDLEPNHLMNISDLSRKSMFFDLSNLQSQLPTKYFQVLLTVLIPYHLNMHKSGTPLAVFVEESQVQLQFKGHFSIMDELITVMRYRGIRSFIIATRVDHLSKYIRDTGLMFQFRSESIASNHLFNKYKPWSLQNYELLVKTPFQPQFEKIELSPYHEKEKQVEIAHAELRYYDVFQLSSVNIRIECLKAVFWEFIYMNEIRFDISAYQTDLDVVFAKIKEQSTELIVNLEFLDVVKSLLLQTVSSTEFDLIHLNYAIIHQCIPIFAKSFSHIKLTSLMKRFQTLLIELKIKSEQQHEDFLLLSI